MDCNKDEAARAKEIAEQKLTSKDYTGAKHFALKAFNIFPALEGIHQMIATLDVYLAAEVKIKGESDWYSVLCTDASADEESVRKQYRKLALQLHPDKNKTVGAEGAFKLISEAWSVLSDKTRKMVYDQNRSIKTSQLRSSPRKRARCNSNSSSGFYDFANNVSNVKARKTTTAARRRAAAPCKGSELKTFWTSCNKCRMQYEYLRVYLNHNLLCPNCHEAFFAEETGLQSVSLPTQSNGQCSSVSGPASQQSGHKLNNNSTPNNAYDHGKVNSTVQETGNMSFQQGVNLESDDNPHVQWGAFSRTEGVASASVLSSAAVQAARKKAQALARKEARQKKRSAKQNAQTSGYVNVVLSNVIPDQEQHIPKVQKPAKRSNPIEDETVIFFGGTEASGNMAPSAEQCVNSNISSETVWANGVSSESGKAKISSRQNNLSRMLPQTDIRKLLMDRAKVAISKKLEEWNSAEVARLEKVARLEEEEKAKQKLHSDKNNGKAAAEVNRVASYPNKLTGAQNNRKETAVKNNSAKSSMNSAEVAVQSGTIDVPDPDFHNFDKDRSERSFKSEQIWATYDSEDGMPRFYALVQNVISFKPFKIRMSFLNSKSNSEWGPLDWVGSGFAKTCGDFRRSKYEFCSTVNIFSHRVKGEKGRRGTVTIVPRKGEAWALYRNWSPDWNVHTPDDVIYKYDMVEVLDDYNEEQGVSVTPLLKVAGFKTVFHRHMDPNEAKRIPREEMFRFSHQVPSHLLTGEEARNAPVGCRELDPAATPLDLLKVITEVNEDTVMETTEQPVR